jgi:hypothetical protein
MTYIVPAATMANSTARQAAMMECSSMGLETHSPLGMNCSPHPDSVLSAYYHLVSSP